MKEDGKPVYRDHICRTPAHLRDSAKNYIKKLLDEGIIAPQTEVTPWCTQVFFTSKKGSTKPHFIIDYVPLNKEVIRPHWPFIPSEHACKIFSPKAGWFISVDLTKGYFQCELPPASRDLTTFMCEEGWYKFCRYPMGLSSSSDIFNRNAEDLMKNIDTTWYVKVVDNIIVSGRDQEECYT